MRRKLRVLIGLWICFLPLSGLRILFYRWFFSYRIAPGAHIGWGTLIVVDRATIGKATIGRFNRFQGPFELTIGDGALIVEHNHCYVSEWVRDDAHCGPLFRQCRIGRNVIISRSHVIDPSGGFELGDGSWIAGVGSQFWSHGAGATKEVVIGSNCYIGSAVRFSPGSGVGDNCLVSLATVLLKRLDCTNALVGGCPGRVLKENFDWRTRPDVRKPVGSSSAEG